MIVQSKLVVDKYVPKTLGLFDSVPYTCHEFGHTWCGSCRKSWIEMMYRSFMFSLKCYAPLYAIGALFKLRDKKTDKKKLTKNTIYGIVRSSIFLASNASNFLFWFCAYGAIFGKFHGMFGFAIGILSAFISIILERKSRRGLLALYVFNQASETIFKMAVSRGYVTPINKGEVYLFALSNLVYMSLFRSSNLPPFVQSIFEKVIGDEETKTFQLQERNSPRVSRSSTSLLGNAKVAIKRAVNQINAIGPCSQVCKHSDSCFVYVLKGALKYFSAGYAIQILLEYRSIFRGLTQGKLSILKKSFSKISLAKYFCAYVTLFRIVNCFLRHIIGKDHPEIFGGIAGLISGFSANFYPSVAISMYAFTKLLDILCMKAVVAKRLPHFPNFDVFLYTVSMATLFQAAVFEPHNIRPSYWTFVSGLSGRRFPLMFRKILEKFGTKSSTLYPDFVPSLDPTRVKSEEVKRVLALHGKWPF